MVEYSFQETDRAAIERLWYVETFIKYQGNTQSLSRWQVFLAAEKLANLISSRAFSGLEYGLVLFEQRDHFIISLLAMAMSRRKSVLPPNLTEKTLSDLKSTLSPLLLFSDTSFVTLEYEKQIFSKQIDEIIHEVKQQTTPFDFERLNSCFESIRKEQIWLYTSGSTGTPKKVMKTWANMIQSAKLAIDRFGLSAPCYIVSTVPNQHMYGLETSIFWPLMSHAKLWYGKPLYPAEVTNALTIGATENALLVSTPLHLEKLISAEESWSPSLDCILSATSPLSRELAENVEMATKARLFEVYGSTETASIASRRTATDEFWQNYESVQFKQGEEESVLVKSAGLDAFSTLNDQIEVIDDHHFKLGKRNTDLIKVAGKRASLAEINAQLQALKDLEEGVFIPCPNSGRLSAFVVSKNSKAQIMDALRKRIDPVFLPRPLVFVDKLPRNEVGKILYNELLDRLQ